MTRIIARTPTRVDLGGGTLDLVPIHRLLKHPITVNIGVTLFAESEVSLSSSKNYEIISEDQEKSIKGSFAEVCASTSLPLLTAILAHAWSKELPPLIIRTRAGSPAGAGMGGSSCLGVALFGSILKMRGEQEAIPWPEDQKIVSFVQDIETEVIRVPTGCQDYWGGLRGGINIIRFPPGGTQVKTLPASSMKRLNDELILCFSGKSRASGRNNWDIFKAAFDGDQNILSRLDGIGIVAHKLADAIQRGDYEQTLAHSEEEWQLRRQLWPQIVTSETEALDAAALKAGARFTRVCGAGGGGVMAVFAPQDKREDVIVALTKAGGRVLAGQIAERGLDIRKEG